MNWSDWFSGFNDRIVNIEVKTLDIFATLYFILLQKITVQNFKEKE